MSESVIASIDQGTSSTRVLIISKKGEVLGSHQMEHKQHYPKSGHVEHDPLEIWNSVKTCLSGALSQVKDEKVEAIGITNQRETTVVWNKETGKAIYNAIVWQDTRTENLVKEMEQKMGVKGNFAPAYVIAHEVGHHVQNQLGMMRRVDEARRSGSASQARQASVRLELQADCYAGIWANHADAQRQILEPGDIRSALDAAQAVGDDTLQKQSQGYVVPDSFTHGSSQQRMAWFMEGYKTGQLKMCDTFTRPDPAS